MTQPHPPAGVRDFTIPMEPIRFRVGPDDNDLFSAPAIISPVVLKRFAAKYAELQPLLAQPMDNIEATLAALGEMLAILVPGAEGQRLKLRLLDEDHPLDLQRQVLPIIYYLMESWGLRPTTPSSDSPNGSPTRTGDTPSTDGASAEASTNTP